MKSEIRLGTTRVVVSGVIVWGIASVIWFSFAWTSPLEARSGDTIAGLRGANDDEELRRELTMASRACHESGVPECDAVLEAVRTMWLSSFPDSGAIDRALDAALERRRVTSPKNRKYPALLFWIDRLAEARLMLHFSKGSNRDKEWNTRLQALGRHGIILQAHRTGVSFRRSFLKNLALTHQDSFWGSQAFLEMTYRGWRVSDGCGDNAEYEFLDVIKHGEQYLRAHPTADISQEVLLEVARAYETWWSASVAGPGLVERSLYGTADGEQARRTAIRLYRQYLKGYAGRDRPLLEKRVLALERKQDTIQRKYICIDE